MQRVLLSATTVPTYTLYPGKFYIYSFMKVAVGAGLSLVPLYMGYHYQKIANIKVLRYLSSFFLLYMVIALTNNVFFYIKSSALNLRDYWIILFPISQNYFIYAVSCVLLFCSIPLLTKRLNTLSTDRLKRITIGLTIAFVLLPTLFNKDIWGFQEGKNVVWIFYLFFIGYVVKQLNLEKKIKFKFLHLGFSLGLLFGLILLMTQVSLFIRGDASTANRFSVPYSLFSVYYALSLFLFSESIAQKISLKATGTFIATSLIVTQVLTSWPLTNYRVSTFWKIKLSSSGLNWLLNILKYTGIYLLIAISLITICLLLQKSSLYKKRINDLSFDSPTQFYQKLRSIKSWIYRRKALFFVAIFFYFFTCVQLFLLDKTEGWSQTFQVILKIFTQRQSILILTTMIIMGFFLLLLLLMNRFWYVFSLTFLIDLLLTVSSVIKVNLRDEPVFPSDLKMLNSISELLSMVSPVLVMTGAILILVLTISSIVVQRKLQHQYALKFNWKKRIIGIITLSVLFSSVFFINHKNSPSFLLFNLFRVNKLFINQGETVLENGPIIQFLNNIDIKIMDKPENYSKNKIEELMKKYDAKAEKINQTRNDWLENQTLILNLSETFSDPARVPNLNVLNDPIPTIKELMKKNTGGTMLSVGYGGGTANMEWQSLTGLDISSLSASLVTPYTQLVGGQHVSPNITNLFDEKIAIHPFTASLYQRKSVFEKFGFDKFYYVDSPDKLTYTDKIERSPRISDESAYKETLKALQSNTETTQFIQLSTMQNHMPYQDYYDKLDYSAEGKAVLESRKGELSTFMQGLHYTDEAVKEFIKELDKIQKPITFVFYGDHLPSLYSGNDQKKYGLEHHETDYFIYSNAFSRDQIKKLNKNVVSPFNFNALAFEQANIKVTPFYALLTQVTNKLPASTIDPVESVSNRYNGKQVFVTEKNKIILEKDLTEEQKEILEDYKYIQYDLVAGEQYSAEWAEQKVK
ncbi:LTA synthase family protein [Enterococcus plantarum]|nr:LTA synthase family protein [Enterococcus plantarum]